MDLNYTNESFKQAIHSDYSYTSKINKEICLKVYHEENQECEVIYWMPVPKENV